MSTMQKCLEILCFEKGHSGKTEHGFSALKKDERCSLPWTVPFKSTE